MRRQLLIILGRLLVLLLLLGLGLLSFVLPLEVGLLVVLLGLVIVV